MSQGQLAATPVEGKFFDLMAAPANRDRISAALGDLANADTFLAQIAIAISSDPDLTACTIKSKMDAAHTCATLGLFPSLQHVALIPRKMFKGTEHERLEIDVMPQWQGYKALLERVPEVLEVMPVLVHTTDQFATAGDGPDMQVVEHKYNPFDANRSFENAKSLAGGYAVITYRDGRPKKYHFVTTAYIEKCRGCAETQAVWNKWYGPQARKTVLRSTWSARIINVDPLVSGRMTAVTKADDSILGNDPRMVIDESPRGPAVQHQSRSAAIAGQIASRKTQSTAEVEKQYDLEPGTLKQPTQPVEGELTHDEPQNESAGPSQNIMGDFLDLLAEVKLLHAVERLRDHYTGPDSVFELTDEQRTEINRCCDGKREEISPTPTKSEKPKKQEQKTLGQ